MKIKTYQAATLQEAFQAIKSELGPDAVIVTTKYVRKGWSVFRPFGRSLVEITAACDEPVEATSSLSMPAGDPATTNGFDAALRSSLGTAGHEEGASGQALSLFDRMGKGAHVLTATLTDDLIQRGCEPWTASRIVSEAVMRVPLSPPVTEQSARAALDAALRDVILQHATVGGPLLAPADKHKIILLIGPTGAGKTTTAVKLAAQYRIKEGRSVALIKLEQGRAGAVDSLQLQAAAIGLGLDVARNARELADYLWVRRETDLVLIDTAGRSPLDREAMALLKDCLAAESAIEVHLVVPATTLAQDLEDIMGRYAALPIHRLLFTKLDETSRYGRLFDALCRMKLPVSYFGLGQRVTDDLDVAKSEDIANLLLDRSGQGEGQRHEQSSEEPALSGARTGSSAGVTLCGEDRRLSLEGGHTWISR